MLNFAEYLVENRIEFVKKAMSAAISAELDKRRYFDTNGDTFIDTIARRYDPTAKKLYTQWLLKQWLTNERADEDLNGISQDLTTFERVKARMPADQRDINRFKTYYDLRNAISPFEESKSNKEVKKEEVAKFKKDIKVVYNGPEGQILIPTNKTAACFLGRGTKWCTAASSNNMFHAYTKNGPLYIMLHSDGRKWQLHADSSQIMDEKDTPISTQRLRSDPLFIRLKPIVAHEFTKNATSALKWASIIGSRFPEGEKVIASSASTAFKYAADNLRGRFPEGESVIFKSPNEGLWYAELLGKRIPEVENTLLNLGVVSNAFRYAETVIKGRWPELEKKIEKAPSFVKDAYWNMDVIKSQSDK